MARALKWCKRIVLAAAAALFALMLAIILGSIWGTNSQWRQPAHGQTIWIADNGFHTEFVFPAQSAQMDWYRYFPPGEMRSSEITDHVIIGWGERGFYLETPTWADARFSVLSRAALGSEDTLMHVYHMREPLPGTSMRPITISEEQYARLARNIAADIEASGLGKPIDGYGERDVFYAAHGRYSLLYNCNSWTGEQLRRAGVTMGIWTPLPWSVMRWIPEHKENQSDRVQSP